MYHSSLTWVFLVVKEINLPKIHITVSEKCSFRKTLFICPPFVFAVWWVANTPCTDITCRQNRAVITVLTIQLQIILLPNFQWHLSRAHAPFPTNCHCKKWVTKIRQEIISTDWLQEKVITTNDITIAQVTYQQDASKTNTVVHITDIWSKYKHSLSFNKHNNNKEF